MIEIAGGEDVLGLAGEASETVSWEALAQAGADVIVVMPCGYDAPRAEQEALAHGERLRELGASRIVAVNASAYFSRPGPRLVDGLELLARVLHPQRLPDVSLEGRAIELDALVARR